MSCTVSFTFFKCMDHKFQIVVCIHLDLSNVMVYQNRQLEAIVRIAESLAKMRLEPFAYERDVDEALRLFQVSTLDAAMSGSLTGVI